MRKINNPFSEKDDGSYRCFGCSPFNVPGLKLEFWDGDDEITARWMPSEHFEGFAGIVHGGIQATLMDEAASWFIFAKCGTAGVTTDMSIRYLRPVYVSDGAITIRARLKEQTKRMITLVCKLTGREGIDLATAEIRYLIFPEHVAREKYNYPGIGAFSGG